MLSLDDYWKKLVVKIHNTKEELPSTDLTFYRLTSIRGEMMVDGPIAYFQRRFDEFENDMNLLKEIGFQDLAEEYLKIKKIMFGEKNLNVETITEFDDRYYSDEEAAADFPAMDQLEKEISPSYDKIVNIIKERFEDYRIKFGIKNGLFRSE
jgi:hypothetical protein